VLRNEDIYEALFDEDAFNNLPNRLAGVVNARSALINWVHTDGEIANLAYCYFDKAFMDDYAASFIHKDPWVEAAQAPYRLNKILNASQIVSNSVFERSEIYNDLIRHHDDDTMYCIGGAFSTKWGAGIVGVNRGKNRGAFDEDAVMTLEGYAAVLRRVLMVRGEIAAHRRSAALATSVHDIVGLASIVVRKDLRVVHINEAGEAVLRRGLGLYSRQGYLAVQGEDDSKRLSAAVARATAPVAPKTAALTVERKNAETSARLPAYHIVVTPLPGAGTSPRALLLFRDPDLVQPSLASQVRALFSLTATEAELAIALSEGASVAQIASGRSVRESTVRSQLKGLAAKMQCSRQSEIAAVVAKLPPLQSLR
jgi:DNA-binding CsgD family transcriptional regulator